MDCSVAVSPMIRMTSPQCSLVYRMVSLLFNSTHVFLCYALRLDDDLKFLTKLCDLWISKLSSNKSVSVSKSLDRVYTFSYVCFDILFTFLQTSLN